MAEKGLVAALKEAQSAGREGVGESNIDVTVPELREVWLPPLKKHNEAIEEV